MHTKNYFFCIHKVFQGKYLFECKIRFAVKKNTKKSFSGNFKIIFFCRHQKSVSHTISYNFHIREFYDTHFFLQKNKNLVFLSPDCFIWSSLNFLSNFIRNRAKIVWQALFYTLNVWNCITSIFRCTEVNPGTWNIDWIAWACSLNLFGLYLPNRFNHISFGICRAKFPDRII